MDPDNHRAPGVNRIYSQLPVLTSATRFLQDSYQDVGCHFKSLCGPERSDNTELLRPNCPSFLRVATSGTLEDTGTRSKTPGGCSFQATAHRFRRALDFHWTSTAQSPLQVLRVNCIDRLLPDVGARGSQSQVTAA